MENLAEKVIGLLLVVVLFVFTFTGDGKIMSGVKDGATNTNTTLKAINQNIGTIGK